MTTEVINSSSANNKRKTREDSVQEEMEDLEPLQKRSNQDFDDLKMFLAQHITKSNKQLRNDLTQDLTLEFDRKSDAVVENLNIAAHQETNRVNCKFVLLEDKLDEQKMNMEDIASKQNDRLHKLREDIDMIKTNGITAELTEDELLRRYYIWEDEKRRCISAANTRLKDPELMVKITNNSQDYYRFVDGKINPNVIKITDIMGDSSSYIKSSEIIEALRGKKILKCKVRLIGTEDDFSARKRKILLNRRRFKNIGAVDLVYEKEWQFDARWLLWKNELKVINSFGRTMNGYDKLILNDEAETQLIIFTPGEVTKLLKSETTLDNLRKLASEEYFTTDGRLVKIPEPYLTQCIKRKEENLSKFAKNKAVEGWGKDQR